MLKLPLQVVSLKLLSLAFPLLKQVQDIKAMQY